MSPLEDVDDDLLGRVAVATAAELETFCRASGLTYANERDHLSRCCKVAVARITDDLPAPRPALSPFGFGDRHDWTGLGGVDVVFRWRTREPTFLELKCGAGKNVFRPCAWDAVKLATALLGRNASSGYMLAGAPTSAWSAGYVGAELFESAEWNTLGPAIRDRFLADWRFWESESTPHVPGRVPATFRTVAIHSAAFEVADTPWELRLASIHAIDTDWLVWPTTV